MEERDCFDFFKVYIKRGIILYFIFIIIILINSFFTKIYIYKYNNENIGFFYNYNEYENFINQAIEIKSKENNNLYEIIYYIDINPTYEQTTILKNKINNNYNNINKYIKEKYVIYEVKIDDKILYLENINKVNILKEKILNEIENDIIFLSEQKVVTELPAFSTDAAVNEYIASKQQTSRGGARREESIKSSVIKNYKYISQYFEGNYPNHSGVDYAADYGTSIHAWQDGEVIYSGWNGNYGLFVAIQHSDNSISSYAHLSSIKVEKGEKVKSNQIIGLVGSTGKSTGPHLHFEILINGKFVNPLKF